MKKIRIKYHTLLMNFWSKAAKRADAKWDEMFDEGVSDKRLSRITKHRYKWRLHEVRHSFRVKKLLKKGLA